MWISSKQLVAAGLLVWGCSSQAEAQGGVCPDMHSVTKPIGEATQFGDTGGELVDSVSGSHVIEVPSDTDPDRTLTVVVSPVPGAEVTEQVSAVSLCQRVSVPVHLSIRVDDGSIVGELDGEALLQYEGSVNGTRMARAIGGEAPASAFASFPSGEFPELVVTHLAIQADGSPGAGFLVTREDRADTAGEQPTLRGRSMLDW